VARWAGAFGAIFLAGWLLGLASLPSSYLFGALLAGLAIALWRPGAIEVPPFAFRAAQAITGVALEAPTCSRMRSRPPPRRGSR
jgi:uncharacterized protein